MPGSPELVVRGDRVLVGGVLRAADVGIVAGRIVAVAPVGYLAAATVIDADGRVVLPGAVDAHVHGNDPGRADWEGFETLTAAAAAGGVTTVVDMPIDSDPPTVTADAVLAKRAALSGRSHVDVALWGGLVPGHVADLDPMLAAGVVGFKAFCCESGWDDFPAVDDETLRRACAVAARADVPIMVHAELDGTRAAVQHAPRGSVASEVAAIRWVGEHAARAGARIHVAHVSAAAAVEEARRWPAVTVETCPHYLVLDDAEVAEIGPRALCSPPVRDAANRARLWELLEEGAIASVASDHSPCPPAWKEHAVPWRGISGVQTTLPLLLSTGRFTLEQLSHLTTAAAAVVGLTTKGEIGIGFDADLVLVDPAVSWVLTAADLRTRSPSLSPYLGRAMVGRVHTTIVGGRTVFRDDALVGSPSGRFVAGTRRG